jgi:FMN phosphatase YigB (HAD superfamily)
VLALVLAGCRVAVDVTVDVNEDGSGSVRVGVGLDDAAMARIPDLAEQLQTDDLAAAGWKVDGPEKEGDGLTWVRASKPFADPDQLGAIIEEISGPEGPFRDFTLSRTRSFGETTIELSGTVDLSEGPQAFSDEQLAELLGGDPFGGNLEQIEQEEGKPVPEMVDFTVTADLPGAEPVSVQPSFADTEPTELTASSTETRWAARLWAFAAVLLAVGAIVVLVLGMRRSARDRALVREAPRARLDDLQPAPVPEEETVRLVPVAAAPAAGSAGPEEAVPEPGLAPAAAPVGGAPVAGAAGSQGVAPPAPAEEPVPAAAASAAADLPSRQPEPASPAASTGAPAAPLAASAPPAAPSPEPAAEVLPAAAAGVAAAAAAPDEATPPVETPPPVEAAPVEGAPVEAAPPVTPAAPAPTEAAAHAASTEPPPRRLELVVLDAMGVVFTTGSGAADLLANFASAAGSTLSRDDVADRYAKCMVGQISVPELWISLGVAGDPEDLTDRFLALHRPSAGLREFLDRMQERGLPVAVVANDVAEWSHRLRAAHKLDELTSVWVTSGDVAACMPDAPLYSALIRASGIDARNSFFIANDLEILDAARSFGFAAAWFNPEAGADADIVGYPVIRSFKELGIS